MGSWTAPLNRGNALGKSIRWGNCRGQGVWTCQTRKETPTCPPKAGRKTETVPHAKARRHEEENPSQSSRSSRLRALRKRCLTRRHEGTKKKNWVSLRVLRGFARYGDGASREGAKARRGKTGAVFAFFAASRATGTVPHAKARRHEERRPVKLRVLRGFARDFLLDLHEAEKMRSPGDC